MTTPVFDAITERIPDSALPPLDKTIPEDGYETDAALTNDEILRWMDEGVLIRENVVPHDLIDAYAERWQRDHNYGTEEGVWGGYRETGFLHVDELRALLLDSSVTRPLGGLFDTDQYGMGLHLCLTGWKSTTRNWHPDDYLNPAFVNQWYAAVWIALDDIDPDAGPFQYAPGTHAWPVVRQDRLKTYVDALPNGKERYGMMDNPSWPRLTEPIVAVACEDEMKAHDQEIVTYVPKKGDLLIWHAALLHRGTIPNNPNLERRVAIAHFSEVNHRPDLDEVADRTQEFGGTFWKWRD